MYRKIVFIVWFVLIHQFQLIRMIEKSVYSKRKIWVTDSEERELIISFFVVKYSREQERFLLVLLNGYSKGKWYSVVLKSRTERRRQYESGKILLCGKWQGDYD